MGIKLIKKTNEAAYTAIKNPEQAAFIIDCGTPEKAKELSDAFYKVAFVGNGWQYNKEVIGGELIQGWNVDKFFTACVDPCDKAAAWCEEWLRNSGGAAPAIQGNSAGLESNNETATNTAVRLASATSSRTMASPTSEHMAMTASRIRRCACVGVRR